MGSRALVFVSKVFLEIAAVINSQPLGSAALCFARFPDTVVFTNGRFVTSLA